MGANEMDGADADADDDDDDDDDDDEDDSLKYMQLAVHGVLAEIPSSLKRNMAKNILDILIKHRSILAWNRHGVLLKPKNSSVGKLKNLIANLIYSNRGTPHVNKTIAHIIGPIFQEIKDLVINKRV